MARCLNEAVKMLCLHNRTRSIMFAQNITSHFEITLSLNLSTNDHAKCLHKSLLLLHKKHKHFARLAHSKCWCAITSECIRVWAACKTAPCSTSSSNVHCQHRWDFLGRQSSLPNWLSLTAHHSDPDCQSYRTHMLRYSGWCFGGIKWFAIILQNVNSDGITLENRFRMDACTQLFHSSSLLVEKWEAH